MDGPAQLALPQGDEKPAPKPAPEWLDWEQWIGPAPMRPYAECYHPMSWRGFWDFGTGAWATWPAIPSTCPTWAWTCQPHQRRGDYLRPQ